MNIRINILLSIVFFICSISYANIVEDILNKSIPFEWTKKNTFPLDKEIKNHFIKNNIFSQKIENWNFDIIKNNDELLFIKYLYDDVYGFKYNNDVYGYLKFIIISDKYIYIPMYLVDYDLKNIKLNDKKPLKIIQLENNRVLSNTEKVSSSKEDILVIFPYINSNKLKLTFNLRYNREIVIDIPSESILKQLKKDFADLAFNYNYIHSLKYLLNKINNAISNNKKQFIVTKKYENKVNIFANRFMNNGLKTKPKDQNFKIIKIEHTLNETILTLQNVNYYENIYIGKLNNSFLGNPNRAFRLNGKPFKYLIYKGKKYKYNPNSFKFFETKEGDTFTLVFDRVYTTKGTLVDSDLKKFKTYYNMFKDFDLHQPGEFVVIEPTPPKIIDISKVNIQKDEFEKTSEFEKRKRKIYQQIKEKNKIAQQKYQQELQKFQKELISKRLAYKEYLKNFENPDKRKLQIEKTLSYLTYLSLGYPKIKEARYNADKEEFKISIVSSLTFPNYSNYAKNLPSNLDSSTVLESIKDLDIFHSILNIKKDKSYEYRADLAKYLCWQEWVKSCYFENSNNFITYGRLVAPSVKNGFNLLFRRNPTKSVISFYLPPNITKNIYLKSTTPVFQQTILQKVPLKYAKKFKEILLDKNFYPTLIVKLENKQLKILKVKEIEDPQKLVEEKLLNESKNSIDKLKLFIKKYPNSIFISKAKEYIAQLEYEDAKYDINKMKKFLRKYKNNHHFYELGVKRLRELEYDMASNDINLLKKLIQKYPDTEIAKKAKDRINYILEEEKRKEALIAKYKIRKKVGDIVCMKWNGFLGFYTFVVKGQVDSVKDDMIRIRILDTENQAPSYKGIVLYRDTILWDKYYNWMLCR